MIRKALLLILVLVVMLVSGCCSLSGLPISLPGDSGAGNAPAYDFATPKIDASKSITESNVAVSQAAQAIEKGDKVLYNSRLALSVRAGDNSSFPRPCKDVNSFATALKNAKVTDAYPMVVYYESTVDGKKYEFYALMEDGEWRLVV